MAQITTSLTLVDGEGATVLSALNEQFSALQSASAGTTEPTLTVAGMLWFDTLNKLLYLRNAENTGWTRFPIDFNTGDILGDIIGGGAVGGGNVDTGDVITLDGDVIGDGVFDSFGNMGIDTAINLPNVVCIVGGSASSTFPGETTGPYGVFTGSAGLPAGGTAGQVIIKNSSVDFDASWGDIGSFSSSEYCPGYTYTFVDVDTWKVNGLDVTNLFSVGRRLKFTGGDQTFFGEITASTFSTDTTIDMSMFDGTELNANLTEVCLTSGSTSWTPISADPFSGTAINAIVSGHVSATKYWVIVGDSGKLAYSSDAGINWTLATTGTTAHLNDVDYNPTNDTFIAVGDGGVTVRSTNGTTWTADTSEFAAFVAGTGTGNIASIVWDDTVGEWGAFYDEDGTNIYLAKSTDNGVNWTQVASMSTTIAQFTSKAVMSATNAGGSYFEVLLPRSEDILALDDPSDTLSSLKVSNGAAEGVTTAILGFTHSTTDYIYNAHADGHIMNNTTQRDQTTFGSSQVNSFAYSNTHTRVVAVANDGKIGYVDAANFAGTDPIFTLVSNGFDPLADITNVHWDPDDGVFIATASNGQICRSSTGIT